jgi:beta-lactamase superfamily II metal-dependent hydrolase
LRVNHPNLTTLKFVALTHPHADHCMGTSRYFEHYVVEEFWYFHSFALHACMGFFKAMHDKKTEDKVEKALQRSTSAWHTI